MRSPYRKPFAKRSLGQNFLTDPNYIRKIIAAVDPKPDDHIIEIGPGRGALTEQLVSGGTSVIAVELDRDLTNLLREEFSEHKSFRVFEVDALEVNFKSLIADDPEFGISDLKSIKLVANLPYYISTAILQRLAEQREVFSELVLMFQKEVVDRITAMPGDSERGFLTAIAEASFEIERLFDVPPSAFRPQPKVWSSVVRLVPKKREIADEAAFRQMLSVAFAQKRKTIFNNLKTRYENAAIALEQAAIDPKRRAESLTLVEWLRLNNFLN